MNNPVVSTEINDAAWTIVFDDACPVVQKLGWLVRQWDRNGTFRFIGRDSNNIEHTALVQKLDQTPWSLMLVDKAGNEWLGPEAIPFILKNLPSGKIAAVTYTVPGTMWLTRQLYLMVSRNRRLFSRPGTKANPIRDTAHIH